MSTLLDCADHRRFLHDARDRTGLTNKELAKALGRSPSWLSLMLAGQRPFDPALLPVVTEALGLSVEEQLHLEALVDLEAPSERARQKARATLDATRDLRTATLRSDAMAQVLGQWWVQAIYVLADCDGFRADPDWLAEVMVPPITPEQARMGVDTLLELGMFETDDEGRVRKASSAVGWTPQELPKGVQSSASRTLHRSCYQLGGEALDRFVINERHSGIVVFAMSEDQLAPMRSKLRELERELTLAAHESPSTPNRTYVLSTMLFPLSHYTDWEAPPDAVGDAPQSTQA